MSKKEINKGENWVIALISLLLGAAILWLTYYFYYDDTSQSSLVWYRWLQPILMVIGGFMCFGSSVMIALRKPEGIQLLKGAISILPIILLLRLIIVIFILAGSVGSKIANGTIFNKFGSYDVIILMVVVFILILFSWIKTREKK